MKRGVRPEPEGRQGELSCHFRGWKRNGDMREEEAEGRAHFAPLSSSFHKQEPRISCRSTHAGPGLVFHTEHHVQPP